MCWYQLDALFIITILFEFWHSITVFGSVCSLSYLTVVRDVSAAVATVDPERKDRTGAVKQILSSLLSGGGNTTMQVPL